MDDSGERFWQRRARLTALRRNFAAWLSAFLPAALVTSALGAAALLILRQRDTALTAFWPIVAAAFLAAAISAFLRARRDFFTPTDALLRLDVALHLHNRLTAAARGVGDFPPPRAAPDGFTWRWQPIAGALAACLAVLLLAAWIPVSRSGSTFTPTQEPTAWTETQTFAERLAEANVVEPETVQSLEEKLDALRDQPPEDWFSQSSLEAGDSLRDQTAQSLRALESNLSQAASQLASATNPAGALNDADLQQLADRFGDALANLELGNLPLDADLLKSLQNVDLSQARQLSAAELKKLQERLEKGVGVCQACLAPGEGGEALVNGLLLTPGDGGLSRGPGTGPIGRTQQPTDLGGGVPQQISNDDLSRALPAEVLGLGTAEHDDTPTADTGPTAGGSLATTGTGGDAVWSNNLDPAERETLQRFFK